MLRRLEATARRLEAWMTALSTPISDGMPPGPGILSARYAIPGGAAILIVTTWAVVTLLVQSDRRAELAAAGTNTANLARVFEEHVNSSLHAVDQALSRIKSEVERTGRPVPNELLAAEQRAQPELIGAVAIVDPRGDIVAHSLPSFPPINVANVAHFQSVAARDTGSAEIGTPSRGRVTGAWSFPVVRRLNRPDGSFAGMVHASLQVSYFENFYRSLDLGPDGAIALLGRDGVVRVSVRRADTSAGQQVQGRSLALERVGGGEPHGSLIAASAIDGLRRVISYRELERYPLIVLVGIPERDALARATALSRYYHAGAGVFTAFIAAMAFLLTRSAERQQRAAEALRESEARARGILDSMFAFVGLMTPDGMLVEVNRAALHAAGLRRDAVVGKPVTDTFWLSHSDETQNQVRDALRRAVAGETARVELVVRVIEGQLITMDVAFSPLRDASGRVVQIVASGVDISERNSAVEALLANERRLAALTDNLPGMVYRCRNDPDWTTEFVSRGCLALTGYSVEELGPGGRVAYTDLILAEDRRPVWEAVQRATGSRTAFTLEYRINTASGTKKHVWEQGSGVYDNKGQLVALEGLVLDISERKRAEDALRELSRRLMEVEEEERRKLNRELHDRIGQNLSALGLSLGLTRAKLPAGALDAVGARFDDMGRLVEETSRDVRNIMAELHPAALERYGLLAALRIHARTVSERLGLPIDVRGDDTAPRPSGTVENALFRITQEALNNVSKHARAKQVEIQLAVENGRLSLVIADDGAGFDPGRLAVGDGWGMSTMRERARAVGARLSVESTPGHGTRVIIEFDGLAHSGHVPSHRVPQP